MAYYQRLRDLKEDYDLTQKQVAEIIGVSVNHYGKYERGETDIPFEKVILLANYYDASLDYIAGRTNKKNGMYSITDKDELLLIDRYANLSERNKGKIDLFLEQLTAQQKKHNE